MDFLSFLRGKRVLLIGATGRIGTDLLPEIITKQPKILWVTGRDLKRNVPGSTYMQCTLPEGIASLPKNVDYVIMLAAISRPNDAKESAAEAIQVNVAAVESLLRHYANTSTRIVLTSSVR